MSEKILDRQGAFLHKMRTPLLTFGALTVLLVANVALGYLTPVRDYVWIIELVVLVLMIATVLLFSMEAIKEPGLVRLFSVLGFCWVAIMFAMTLNDYFTR